MIKAVLDTNVYVSALLFPKSLPALVTMRGLLGDYQIVVSDKILAELRNSALKPKLVKQYRLTQDVVEKFASSLLREAILVVADLNSVSISRDPNDDHVLAAALISQSDCIVTGDNDLLTLKQFNAVKILTVAEFAAITGLTS